MQNHKYAGFKVSVVIIVHLSYSQLCESHSSRSIISVPTTMHASEAVMIKLEEVTTS